MSIRKVRKITDARFVEISAVDKPACELATIQHVRLAKRSDPLDVIFDFNPAAIEAIGATAEEAGMLRKMFGWLFRKKELDTDSRNDLEDSKFAYIDSKGDRHLPIHDAQHVRNALARFNQTGFESASAKAAAHAKIVAAAKKFGIEVSDKTDLIGALRKNLIEQLTTQGADEMAIDEGTVKELIALLKGEKPGNLEKKGAKFSAETKGHLTGIRKSMETAGGYFGKCIAKYADDADLSNGVAHHTTAMQKMDTVLSDWVEDGDVADKHPADATSPAKAADITNLIKAAVSEVTAPLAKQVEEMSGQVKTLTEKNAELDKENAVLKGKLDVLGNQPIKPRAIIGNPFTAVSKGDAAENLNRQAGGSNGAERIDISKIDPSDPNAYRKALTAVYQNPQTMRDPGFKVDGDQALA